MVIDDGEHETVTEVMVRVEAAMAFAPKLESVTIAKPRTNPSALTEEIAQKRLHFMGTSITK